MHILYEVKTQPRLFVDLSLNVACGNIICGYKYKHEKVMLKYLHISQNKNTVEIFFFYSSSYFAKMEM